MRIGVDLAEPGPGRWRAWRDTAVAADELGLDGVLVRAAHGHDALVLAASLADVTRDIRVVAVVPVGLHALHLAERIAVADQVLAGRLVVALDVAGDPGLAAETLDVLRLALSENSFRHEGERWTIPAGLHGDQLPNEFRLTPPPAALDLPVWLTGAGAEALARESSRTWLPGQGEDGARFWAGHAAAAAVSVRPARRRVRPGPVGQTVAALQREAREWGLSFALLTPSAGGSTVADVERLATAVRPRLQLPEVPSGLERFWVQTGIDD